MGSFLVTKEGRVNVDCSSLDITSSGIIYQSGDKYGVLTLDGKKDSGPVYAAAQEARSEGSDKGFIAVRQVKNNAKDVNTCGLIDKDGNEIIPCKYASITVLNDRFVRVVTADKETKDEDKAVVYFTDKMFSLSPSEGDTLYTGKWEVFDTVKKAMVPSVSGTLPTRVEAKGQFVIYKDDQGNENTADAAGKAITDGRKILQNGAYVLEINGKSGLYATDDTPLFNFDAREFEVSNYYEPYYVGTKRDSNYNSSYLLLNDKGEKVSAEFSDYLSEVTPDFVLSDECIYKLDGTKAFTDRYTTLKFDKAFQDVYSAHKDDLYTIFDKSGNVLFTGDKEKDKFDGYDFYMYQKDSSGNSYYNFKDKAFNIQGYQLGDWFIKQSAGNVYDLIETRTGTKLLDSSYGRYETVVSNIGKTQYIYAFNSVNGQVAKGDFDIFSVTVK